MPTVYLPTTLRQFNRNQARIELTAGTMPELLSELDAACPGIHERLYDEKGLIKRYINVFVNNHDIRHIGSENIQLAERDEVSFIPAMAGG
jgi:molybdopterin synthase sulfur carrier subunit